MYVVQSESRLKYLAALLEKRAYTLCHKLESANQECLRMEIGSMSNISWHVPDNFTQDYPRHGTWEAATNTCCDINEVDEWVMPSPLDSLDHPRHYFHPASTIE